MSNLIWLVFIFLVVILVISVLWLVWRLRHFSQSYNQTVLDDKLLQNMLGDEALSKELKNALVGKASGVQSPTASPVSSADTEGTGEGENQAGPGPDSSEKKRGTERQASKAGDR
ncbi:MAG: hypothetical protein Q3M30_03500 [Candidatus Electrothrix sp. Rat3]|nr:hypothetical protein [Candidatus Electrothrix rattekaaiensis]